MARYMIVIGICFGIIATVVGFAKSTTTIRWSATGFNTLDRLDAFLAALPVDQADGAKVVYAPTSVPVLVCDSSLPCRIVQRQWIVIYPHPAAAGY